MPFRKTTQQSQSFDAQAAGKSSQDEIYGEWKERGSNRHMFPDLDHRLRAYPSRTKHSSNNGRNEEKFFQYHGNLDLFVEGPLVSENTDSDTSFRPLALSAHPSVLESGWMYSVFGTCTTTNRVDE